MNDTHEPKRCTQRNTNTKKKRQQMRVRSVTHKHTHIKLYVERRTNACMCTGSLINSSANASMQAHRGLDITTITQHKLLTERYKKATTARLQRVSRECATQRHPNDNDAAGQQASEQQQLREKPKVDGAQANEPPPCRYLKNDPKNGHAHD